MNVELFFLPFLAGLPLALVLPLLGGLLRLRDEWLATLGLAHLSASTGLAALALEIPLIWGAPVGAVAGICVKYALRGSGNSTYGLMILAGWSATLLIAANSPLGDALAQGMVDGQLYFAGRWELLFSFVIGVLVAAWLPWLQPRLIRARLFPGFEIGNRLPAWRWHLTFDLLVGLAVATATAILGLMATFALIFIPALISFRHAANWRHSQRLAVGIGITGYGLAFLLALALDQPFGPMLVAVLLLATFASTLPAWI